MSLDLDSGSARDFPKLEKPEDVMPTRQPTEAERRSTEAERHSIEAELDDLELKLRGAREAAAAPDATAKHEADLKLIEQEHIAARQKVRRRSHGEPGAKPSDARRKLDEKLDEALDGTFPASDPISFVEAAPIKEQDRTLPAVEVAEQQQPEKAAAARKSK